MPHSGSPFPSTSQPDAGEALKISAKSLPKAAVDKCVVSNVAALHCAKHHMPANGAERMLPRAQGQRTSEEKAADCEPAACSEDKVWLMHMQIQGHWLKARAEEKWCLLRMLYLQTVQQFHRNSASAARTAALARAAASAGGASTTLLGLSPPPPVASPPGPPQLLAPGPHGPPPGLLGLPPPPAVGRPRPPTAAAEPRGCGPSVQPGETPACESVPQTKLADTSRRRAEEAPKAWPAAATGPPPARMEGATEVTLQLKDLGIRLSMETLLALFPPDGSYNFVHIPYSTNQRRNASYCFINFVAWHAAIAFIEANAGQLLSPWSRTPLTIYAAACQGLAANVQYHRDLVSLNPKHWPVVFFGTQRVSFGSLTRHLDLTASNAKRKS